MESAHFALLARELSDRTFVSMIVGQCELYVIVGRQYSWLFFVIFFFRTEFVCLVYLAYFKSCCVFKYIYYETNYQKALNKDNAQEIIKCIFIQYV